MNIRTSKPVMMVAMTAGIALLAGCVEQQPYGVRNGSYGYQQQGYSQGGRCQSCGVVQDVQQVYVQRNGNGTLGAVLGAVAGGLLGNTVGKGDGRKAATVAGAVAGGVVGNQVGQRSGSGTDVAWQVSVRLDNGQYATITQREDPGVRRGDYVEIRGDHVYPR